MPVYDNCLRKLTFMLHLPTTQIFLQKSIKYKKDSHKDAVLGLSWNKEYRYGNLFDECLMFASASL